MSRTNSAFASLILLAAPALAEEKTLTGAEIKTLLADRIMTGQDGSKSWEQVFQKGGMTLYKVGNAQSQGFWEVRGDQYCSQWPPSQNWACYDMTRDGEAYFFISTSGERTEAKLLK